MTTENARNFLAKELFVKRNIVTFRSLSRELGIHVNEAKNELQRYYDVTANDKDAHAVPTYFVSGEVVPLTANMRCGTQRSDDSAMDMDLEFEEDRAERVETDATIDTVCRGKILLVDARSLDEAMSEFSRIYSVHIYSLSPSRLTDAGLICTLSSKVRQVDVKGGLASLSTVGKITGPHVKLKPGATHQTTASSSKTTLDTLTRAAPKAATATKMEPQTTKGKLAPAESKEQVVTTPAINSKTTLARAESTDKPKGKLDWSRAKPSGKLDWSRANTKEKEPTGERLKEEKKAKVVADSAIVKAFSMSKKPGPEQPRSITKGDAKQRGTKRKSLIDTDVESDSELSSAKAKQDAAASSSIKQEVDCSDEDEDGGVRMLGRRRMKRSNLASDSEMSLRAMMDIDDEQVDCVSRVGKVSRRTRESDEGSEEADEDANDTEKSATVPPATDGGDESDVDLPIVHTKRSRKPRKIIPVGRNGLQKRRVVKSRTTTDAKGYMQTEDYSSYESIEENDEVVAITPKGKGRSHKDKGKEATKRPEFKVEEDEEQPEAAEASKEAKAKATRAKPTVSKSRGKAPKQGGLLNFFGPEKGKK